MTDADADLEVIVKRWSQLEAGDRAEVHALVRQLGRRHAIREAAEIIQSALLSNYEGSLETPDWEKAAEDWLQEWDRA